MDRLRRGSAIRQWVLEQEANFEIECYIITLQGGSMRRRAVIAALTLTPFARVAVGLYGLAASFSILADGHADWRRCRPVEALVGPDGDVHVYEPRPKDLQTLLASGLLVRNGLGLEGWMDRLAGAGDFRGTVVVAAEKVTPRMMQEAGGAIATDPPHRQIHERQCLCRLSPTPSRRSKLPMGFIPGSRAVSNADRGDRCVDRGDAGSIPRQKRIITTHDAVRLLRRAVRDRSSLR